MKRFIILALVMASYSVNAQVENDVSKWMHAVVTIQCGNAYGAAIFLEYKGNHYLLTARHIVFDSAGSDSNAIGNRIILVENNTLTNGKGDDHILLMNLSAGGYHNGNYIFSSPYNDLAIINIDRRLAMIQEFTKTLLRRGYRAITLEDINTNFAVSDNADVVCVGFPDESRLPDKEISDARALWESKLVTLPALTLGKFDRSIDASHFEAHIFTYHGFSGGPIISNNKLIGIISGLKIRELTLPNEAASFKKFRVLYQSFIKSSIIKTLLEELESDIKIAR